GVKQGVFTPRASIFFSVESAEDISEGSEVITRGFRIGRISRLRLDDAGRAARIARYWHPYRRAVERDLDRAVAARGIVLHVSVHSFVERLGGRERTNDFGLLYDPAHAGERRLADRLDRHLTRQGFRVRRNFPYTGREDGFCMRMRVERDWGQYLGMEIELNQRTARRPDGANRLGEALVAAFRAAGGR
ncbi:MAG: N-formylglutamate amidohydrolase, partial [Planctomycetota bacterium]